MEMQVPSAAVIPAQRGCGRGGACKCIVRWHFWWLVHMRRFWTVRQISVGLAGAENLGGQKVVQQLVNKFVFPEVNLLNNCWSTSLLLPGCLEPFHAKS